MYGLYKIDQFFNHKTEGENAMNNKEFDDIQYALNEIKKAVKETWLYKAFYSTLLGMARFIEKIKPVKRGKGNEEVRD